MTTERLAPGVLIDWVAAAAKGDDSAITRLVEQYEGLVRAEVRRHGGLDEIDDLVQETWLRLLGNLDRLREPASLPAWLCSTARNLCRTRYRRRATLAFMPLEPERVAKLVPGLGGDPCGEDALAATDAATLHQAVDRLSGRDRRLAVHLLGQTTYGEISRDLGIPVGSIGPTRDRMLRRLGAFNEIRQLAAAA